MFSRAIWLFSYLQLFLSLDEFDFFLIFSTTIGIFLVRFPLFGSVSLFVMFSTSINWPFSFLQSFFGLGEFDFFCDVLN